MGILLLVVVSAWTLAITAGQRMALVANRWNVGIVTTALLGMAIVASAFSDRRVSDRLIYSRMYEDLKLADSPGQLNLDTDPLFVWVLWLLGRVAPAAPEVLFGVMAALMAAAYLAAASRLLPPWGALAAWVTLLASGWFTAYTVVALRQGLAVACLMVAASMAVTRRGPRWLLFAALVAAPLLHWSALAPAVVVLLLRFRRTPPIKLVAWVWLGLAAAFLLGVHARLLGGLSAYLPQISEYASASTFANYGAGANRLDFLAISLAIGVVGLLAVHRLGDDEVYRRLLAAYLLWNCMFLLLGFVAFSDRLAAYSWFLAPILLWYPLTRLQARKAVWPSVLAMLGVLAVGVLTGSLLQLGGI